MSQLTFHSKLPHPIRKLFSRTPNTMSSTAASPGTTIAASSPEEDSAFARAYGQQLFFNPPRVLIIGAGSRGTAYAKASLNSTNSIIAAVAEPVAYKRQAFGRRFIWGNRQPQPEQEFDSWQQWVKYEKSRRDRERAGEKVEEGIDAVFVCVLDEM